MDGMMVQVPRVSKIRGVWPAIVVDNKDGNGNPGYRVKLKFAWLNDQETTYWARIATPMAGPERGTYMLPEIEDQVLVVFEHGDINRPIVIGALWSHKQEPVENNQSGKNNTKLIKSRSGHRIIFDDKQGAERVIVVDRTRKNKIILDSVNKIIKLECDGDIEVKAKANLVMHANALKIGTSDGVTGKGQQLLSHSAKTFSLKASSGITIGGGNTTINVSNAAATQVSGSGAGELGGAAEEQPKEPIVEQPGPARRSSPAAAAATTASTGSIPDLPPLPPTSPTPPGEDVPLTTLEIVVTGDDGEPQSGIRYEVKDASGVMHEGTTNPEGLIRIDGLPAGNCEVSLPDLDQSEWQTS